MKNFTLIILTALFDRYFGELKGNENNEFLAYVSNYKELTLNITDNVHLGTYECTANNSLGKATKIFKVKDGFVPPKFDITKVRTLV